jgi:hypothetical protein
MYSLTWFYNRVGFAICDNWIFFSAVLDTSLHLLICMNWLFKYNARKFKIKSNLMGVNEGALRKTVKC